MGWATSFRAVASLWPSSTSGTEATDGSAPSYPSGGRNGTQRSKVLAPRHATVMHLLKGVNALPVLYMHFLKGEHALSVLNMHFLKGEHALPVLYMHFLKGEHALPDALSEVYMHFLECVNRPKQRYAYTSWCKHALPVQFMLSVHALPLVYTSLCMYIHFLLYTCTSRSAYMRCGIVEVRNQANHNRLNWVQ